MNFCFSRINLIVFNLDKNYVLVSMNSFSLNYSEIDLKVQSNYFLLKGLSALSVTRDCLPPVEPQNPFINLAPCYVLSLLMNYLLGR